MHFGKREAVLLAAGVVVAILGSAGSTATSSADAWGDRATHDHRNDRVVAPRVRAVDGRALARAFPRAPIAKGDFFPVAVWLESVTSRGDVKIDKRAGINTYLGITENSRLSIPIRNGMRVITYWGARDSRPSGYLLPDEVDMWAGPGEGAWSGDPHNAVCFPEGSQCGYTILNDVAETIPSWKVLYGQFGKGVTFWESRAEASRFVNEQPDLVSADNYWFTDPNICDRFEGGTFFGGDSDLSTERCRNGSNYGRTVKYLRSLVEPRRSKPVWNFVELGHPFTEDWAPTITAAQIRAAVWSGIINGAGGVVYFNHNFGGPCHSQHVLRDECGEGIRPAVSRLNKRIDRLSPLLNAPFVDGLLKIDGAVEAAVKLHRGHFFLITGRKSNGATSATFRLACGAGASAHVLGTRRSVPIRRGAFLAHFGAKSSGVIYRIDGGHTCGL